MVGDVNVLTLILSPAFFYELYKSHASTASKSIIYFIMLTISVSNHYLLNTLNIFFICIIISFLKRDKLFLILTMTGAFLVFTTNDFSNRFNINFFKTNAEKANYWNNSRTTVFVNAVDSFWNDGEILLKGYGYPETSKERALTPSKKIIASTGHSTIIDTFMYFGVISGTFSIYIYFIFGLFWRRLTFYEKVFFPSFFCAALGQLAGTSSDSFIFLTFLFAMLIRVLTWEPGKKVIEPIDPAIAKQSNLVHRIGSLLSTEMIINPTRCIFRSLRCLKNFKGISINPESTINVTTGNNLVRTNGSHLQ